MSDGNAGIDEQYDELLSRAERVLSERLGAATRLGEVERISEPRRRNLLLRCRVLTGPPAAPTSVILKRARQRRYEPDNPKSRPAVGLFRDWAGLEFLNALGDELLASPRFYGGDRQAGFFLMEDLGGNQDLDHVLTCGSADRARHCLVLLAEALGRMHAVSAGRGEQYQDLRDGLGPGDGMHRKRLAVHARDYAPFLHDQCQRLEVDVAPGFLDDVETIAAAMADPGDFLTYTHADACPDNSVVVDDRICLIDYEFGSFRHALLDGVYGWIRFPTCWCVRDIPESVVAEMESVYRQQLARGCPAALDDAAYFRGVADACGYWMLENLAQLLDRSLQYEEPRGTSTNRQRILMRLAAFQQVAERSGHLEGMRKTLASLLEELRHRWRDDTPLYDAFHRPREYAQDDVSAIVDAVRNSDTDRVAGLLAGNGALAQAKLVDEDQTPLLFLAVERGDVEVVRMLLESGADWRVTTRSGWTVLARACSHSTPAIVDLLLEHGANLNERDTWGTLPLYGALGNQTMMLHLLKCGATADLKMAIDMDRLDVAERILQEDSTAAAIRFGTGLTLLHDSARVGDTRLEAMDLLARHGADVNAVTNWEATPLHLAVFYGHARAAKYLIGQGALLGARDDYGLTPMRLAEAKGHTDCVELLRASADALEPSGGVSATWFQSIDAAAGLADEKADQIVAAADTRDEQTSSIDALYSALGRNDSVPHPMDEAASALLFEQLHQRKTARNGHRDE